LSDESERSGKDLQQTRAAEQSLDARVRASASAREQSHARLWRTVTVLATVPSLVALASGHATVFLCLAVVPLGLLAGQAMRALRRSLGRHALLSTTIVPGSETGPSIGLGATIGRGAQLNPGAIIEMGATVGAGALVESGAVVRMGATVARDAVIESGAVVSWGADVKRGARVGAGARIGAGATVAAGAVVPANTWVMPGGDFRGGAQDKDVRLDGRGDSARAVAKGENPSASAALSEPPAPLADPRQVMLEAVFTRIEAELKLASPAVHEQLAPRLTGVRELRTTCSRLLERERGLRAESSPESIARLETERGSLGQRIAQTDDEEVRLSLASAVAAIDEQRRQRQLLARSADRLDAEQTRLFWTLDALAAQLLRMRSAGADLAQSNDAGLARSLEQLQGEIAAITGALEEVAQDERRPGSPEPLATAPDETPPASLEEAAARPHPERTRG